MTVWSHGTIEGRERYPINVRYPRELRHDLDALQAGAGDDTVGPASSAWAIG